MTEHLQFVKGKVSPAHLAATLERLAAGIRAREDLELDLGGERCHVPLSAVERAQLDLEFERDPGKTEVEITLEWRDGDAAG